MQISKLKLNNGIDCLTIQDIDCPSVTTTVLLKNGSRYEKESQSGIAHLIEHMIFKGTKKRPSSKKIAYDVELLGGMMNAFTSYEYTGFYLKSPKDNYIKAIDILADIFQNSIFDSQELKKEKGVILEEIKMYEDIPMAKIEQIFLENIFKDHPLGRNIAGSKKTLTEMSSNDCLSFVEQNYRRENLLIVVAGNFKTGEMLDVLNKKFSRVQAIDKESKFLPANKIPLSVKTIEFNKDIEQTHIVMGGFLEARNKKNRIPIVLGNYILSGGFGSKLFQKLREDLGLAYYINLDVTQFKDIGCYSINIGVDNKNKEKAIEIIKQELAGFLGGKISKLDFERAKNFWMGNLVSSIETSEELANWYGIKYLLENEITSIEKYMAEINKTTIEEVITEWKKYLISENMQVVTLGKNG
jgi:predicted Zn-dependent peptidase